MVSCISFGIRREPPCGDCWDDGECSMNCGPEIPKVAAQSSEVGVESLAEFIWTAEYASDEYPWAKRDDSERAYYLDCAKALLRRYRIVAREPT